MPTPAARLKRARIAAGHATASDAARAHGWVVNTYIAHEAGDRGIRPDAAKRYAAAFGVTTSFLLGIGDVPENTSLLPTFGVPIIGEARSDYWLKTTNSDRTGLSGVDSRLDLGWELMLQEAATRGYPQGTIQVVQGHGDDMKQAVRVSDDGLNEFIPEGEFAVLQKINKLSDLGRHSIVYVRRQTDGFFNCSFYEITFKTPGDIEGATLRRATTEPRLNETIDLATTTEDVLILARVGAAYREIPSKN